jgi:ElaB/YqjD/DUF883 family membrane-anchored ribosome-binding protein
MGNTGEDSGPSQADLRDAASQVGENLRDLGGQVRDAARDKYEQVSGDARAFYDQGRDMAHEWEEGIESFVRDKPLQAVLIAAGVGLLLGTFWKRS